MSAFDPKRTLLLTYVAPSSAAAARTSPGIEIASRFRRSSNTHVKSVVIATLPADRFISLCWKVADFWPISAEAGKKFCHQNCHRNRMRTPTGGFTRKMICKQPNKIGHKRKRAETDERLSEVYKTAALPLS